MNLAELISLLEKCRFGVEAWELVASKAEMSEKCEKTTEYFRIFENEICFHSNGSHIFCDIFSEDRQQIYRRTWKIVKMETFSSFHDAQKYLENEADSDAIIIKERNSFCVPKGGKNCTRESL